MKYKFKSRMKCTQKVISVKIQNFFWDSDFPWFQFKIFSVKSTILLKKLLKSWFHGNFWVWSRFTVLFHTVYFCQNQFHVKSKKHSVENTHFYYHCFFRKNSVKSTCDTNTRISTLCIFYFSKTLKMVSRDLSLEKCYY